MNTITMANALKAVFGAQTLTTASYFPACAQDGTPSGVISAANLASVLGGFKEIPGRVNYDFNQPGANPPVGHGNMVGWFDEDHVGTELDTLGMVADFSMIFQILFGYNNKKILFRWRNGANWENFYVQGSRSL